MSSKTKLLLCCSGSVACVRISELMKKLRENADVEVRVVLTQNSLHFFESLDVFTANGVEVFKDGDEWKAWQKMGDPVLHINLATWADILLLAPLNANTLAKVATGISDNLVTCVVRAWDFASNKPFIFCPAMNTSMWNHPITSQQIEVLKSWGCLEIPPIVKVLACGVEGLGAMAEEGEIVSFIKEKMKT